MNIKVFGELLFERNQNDPLLDHIIICIFGLLKEHITTLVLANKNNQNIYNDIKRLILECLKKRYLSLDNPTYIMRNYICDCISILIISGITCSWKTCIQDLIAETKNGNPELIFIALRSIADCNIIMNFYTKEIKDEETNDWDWNDNLNIKNDEKNKIKDKLKENTDIVFDFISCVYSNINKIEKALKNRIIKAIIDLTIFWTNLNLNILTNQNIFIIMMELINIDEDEKDKFENLKSLAELINSSISNSSNRKLYEMYAINDPSDSPQNCLENIENNLDIKEKIGINNCLAYILKIIYEYIKSQNKNENILWVYAKILSSLLENYIFLFFDFNDEANGTIFNLLKYFITHKKRKISWLFFNTIDSMMFFICDCYRFYGVDDTQKNEFVNYLLNILFNVMENCAYKRLNPNDYSELKKSILHDDEYDSSWTSKNNNELYNNMDDDDFDLDDINLKEYRNSAEHVFFCIYIILKEGLNKDYELLFINQITSLIDLNDDNTKNNYDERNAIKLDVVLLVLRSILIEINKESSVEITKVINNYIYNLTESIYIKNCNINILIDYLLIINNFKNFISNNTKYFEKTIFILLLVSNKKDINQYLIDSCYKVISSLCEELIGTINFENIFTIFLDRFKKIYKLNNYKNIASLQHLISSMFFLMGINPYKEDNIDEKDNEPNNKINLIPFINKILESIANELHLLLESKNSTRVNDLKSGIIKVYILYKECFSHIYYSSSSLKKFIFNDFIPKTIDDLIKIFNLFPNDMDIFDSIIEFYISNGDYIGIHCINNFSMINRVFIDLFNSNRNYFKIVSFLNIIYHKILENLNKNDTNYSEQSQYLLEHFFILIHYFIDYIKKESTFDQRFIEEIGILSEFINEVFPLINIHVEKSDTITKIINTIIFIFEFLQNVIIIFIKNRNNEDLITDIKISLIIKSISSLFNDNIIKCLLLNIQDNAKEEIIEHILQSTWSLLSIKYFNFRSRKELCLLYYQIMLFDCDRFYGNFERCLEMKGIFSEEIKVNNYKNIHDYIFLYKCDKSKINTFINEILLIIYEGKNNDCLNYYFNQLIRKKKV